MADFEITTPDGRKFIVSGENAEGAYQALAQMLGQEAPRGSGYGPDGMTSADRIAAAKGGTLGMSPQREAEQAEFDLIGEQQLRDPGLTGSILAGATQGATLGFGDEILGGLGAGLRMTGSAASFRGIRGVQSIRNEARQPVPLSRLPRGEKLGDLLPCGIPRLPGDACKPALTGQPEGIYQLVCVLPLCRCLINGPLGIVGRHAGPPKHLRHRFAGPNVTRDI